MMNRCATAFVIGILVVESSLLAQESGPSLKDWQDDLTTMVDALETVHPRPFWRIDPDTFRQAVERLDMELAALDNAQRTAGFMELVALLQDGHTRLWPAASGAFATSYPIRLQRLADGVWVRAAAGAAASLVGRRVLRIGSVSADEAFDRATRLTAGDNDLHRDYWAFQVLTSPPLVEALGISLEPDRLRLVLESPAGGDTVEIEPIDYDAALPRHILGEGFWQLGFEEMGRSGPEGPLWLRHPTKWYWFDWLPEERLLYLQYNYVRDHAEESFAAFNERLWAFVDAHEVERFVIDLRGNIGGDAMTVDPLLHGLIRRDDINRRGVLFTLIGPKTFSAGVNLASLLKRHTATSFVGEPTGAGPNHFGDARTLALDRTGLTLMVSEYQWLYTHPVDRRVWLAPDLPAPMSGLALASGQDPSLVAVLGSPDLRTLTEVLRAHLDRGNAGEAAEAFSRFVSRNSSGWWNFEEELRDLGYALMREQNHADALHVMRLYAKAYPEAWNAWDSLGEAQVSNGDRDGAIASYERSLELNPDNHNAVAKLRELRGH